MNFRIERNSPIGQSGNLNKGQEIKSGQFEEILSSKIGKAKDVKVSGHAEKRMLERGIRLTKKDMENISKAVDSLEDKEASESLILYRNMAFITSLKNRTIITAIEEKDMDIVTNIDSAVILK